ncbi:MAG: restriction endonuclease subunit S, partial [bacterium]|nr:restriction endonuclease subunit S [bacterium]
MSTVTLKTQHRPYPEYIDSGIEWLGRIPKGWGVEKLKYIAPQRSKKVLKVPEDAEYIGLENIEGGTGKIINVTTDQDIESAANIFRTGDVLFGKLRPYLSKVAFARSSGYCTGELLVLV